MPWEGNIYWNKNVYYLSDFRVFFLICIETEQFLMSRNMQPYLLAFLPFYVYVHFISLKVPWDSAPHFPQWLLYTGKDALCEVWNSWLICVISENERLLCIFNVVGLIFKWWNTSLMSTGWYLFLYISHTLSLCYSKVHRTCINFSNERKNWKSVMVSPNLCDA